MYDGVNPGKCCWKNPRDPKILWKRRHAQLNALMAMKFKPHLVYGNLQTLNQISFFYSRVAEQSLSKEQAPESALRKS
jgi:hypothetical protein